MIELTEYAPFGPADWHAVVKVLTPWALSIKAEADDIMRAFDRIAEGAVRDFMEAPNPAAARDRFQRAITALWPDAALQAWLDSGGELGAFPREGHDLPPDLLRFSADYFDFLQEIRFRIAAGEDVGSLIRARLEVWKNSLRGWYNKWRLEAMSKVPGQKKELLQWHLGETEQHCATCAGLASGGPHEAGWFTRRGYVPRQPGAKLACHGFNCDCYLTDLGGHDVTIT